MLWTRDASQVFADAMTPIHPSIRAFSVDEEGHAVHVVTARAVSAFDRRTFDARWSVHL